jgi:SAM-dependent methyltransferase
MRDNIKVFVKAFAETFPIKEPVYEFGSLQIGPPGYADLRPFFPNKEYVGCDMREGPGVDRVVVLEDLPMADKSVGTVLSADTIEHVFPVFKAFEEMFRVLRDDGAIVVTSVMDFWIHSHPYDYWRFTPEAFAGLLQPYPMKIVGYQGLPDFPHTVYGVAFKTYHPDLEARCAQFCERVNRDLLHLERDTHAGRSLNAKFKAARKRMTCKVFGPKSEYNKMVHEYRARWTLIGPGGIRRDLDGDGAA